MSESARARPLRSRTRTRTRRRPAQEELQDLTQDTAAPAAGRNNQRGRAPGPTTHAAAAAASTSSTSVVRTRKRHRVSTKPIVWDDTASLNTTSSSRSGRRRASSTIATISNKPAAIVVCPFQRIAADPILSHRVVTDMVLTKCEPQSPSTTWGAAEIQKGFRWSNYPSLLAVLKGHMSDYLTHTTPSKNLGAEFNNALMRVITSEIAQAAKCLGLVFAKSLDQDALRERIRAFFRTRHQTAKTALIRRRKNPKSNREWLSEILQRLDDSDRVDYPDAAGNRQPPTESSAAAAAASTFVSPEASANALFVTAKTRKKPDRSTTTDDGSSSSHEGSAKRRKVNHTDKTLLPPFDSIDSGNDCDTLLMPDNLEEISPGIVRATKDFVNKIVMRYFQDGDKESGAIDLSQTANGKLGEWGMASTKACTGNGKDDSRPSAETVDLTFMDDSTDETPAEQDGDKAEEQQHGDSTGAASAVHHSQLFSSEAGVDESTAVDLTLDRSENVCSKSAAPKEQSEPLSSNEIDTQTPAAEEATVPWTTFKVPESATIPMEGTDRYTVWKKLQAMGSTIATDCPQIQGRPWATIRTLHELVRCRLAAGLFRAALRLCHDSLSDLYKAAEIAATCPLVADSLPSVRHELAGTWCLYAHILWEVGTLSVRKVVVFDDSTDSDNALRPAIWRHHAIKVLHAASSCPLVGNHCWIAVAVARLTLLKSARNSQLTTLTTKQTLTSLRVSIAVCWDCIDSSRCKVFEPRVSMDRPSKQEIAVLASYHLDFSRLTSEIGTVEDLEQSFETVLNLPYRLQGISTGFLIADRECTVVACSELNRLSRLKATLANRSDVALVPGPYACDLDRFVLFRAWDGDPSLPAPVPVPSPPPLFRAGSACSEVEYVCTRCHKSFDTEQASMQHDAVCKPTTLNTPKTPKTLNTFKTATLTAGSACMDVEYVCTKCSKSFDTVHELKQHESSSCDCKSPTKTRSRQTCLS